MNSSLVRFCGHGEFLLRTLGRYKYRAILEGTRGARGALVPRQEVSEIAREDDSLCGRCISEIKMSKESKKAINYSYTRILIYFTVLGNYV